VRIWKKFSSFRKNGTRQLATHACSHPLEVCQNTISFRLAIEHLNKLNGASTCNYCSGSRIDCKESCPKTARSWTCKPSSCILPRFHASMPAVFPIYFLSMEKRLYLWRLALSQVVLGGWLVLWNEATLLSSTIPRLIGSLWVALMMDELLLAKQARFSR
jgi:hypothetical protein